MEQERVIEVKQEIMAGNSARADVMRSRLDRIGTTFVDVMASPGAGKTTLILDLIERLRDEVGIAVIEADIESYIDSEKIKAVGVPSVQLQTNGICHVEMEMVERAFLAFGEEDLGLVFLENIGNLVCPAEFDTGAHIRVMLLSVPEGYDKVYKYPGMFKVVDALIVTKTDYLPMNSDFDMIALKERATFLNGGIEIFETSARMGIGMDELAHWILGKCRH